MKTRQNKVKPLRRREKTTVRKGWKRENSLPPPTYAAGGSYRRGLGPRDCQTFARPSVVELFHRRACYRPPRNFFSPEITARNDERRPRNLTRIYVLFKGQLRGYYSSTGIARNLSKRVHWSRKEKDRDRWFFDGRRTPRCSRCSLLDGRSSPPDLPRYLPLTFGQLLLPSCGILYFPRNKYSHRSDSRRMRWTKGARTYGSRENRRFPHPRAFTFTNRKRSAERDRREDAKNEEYEMKSKTGLEDERGRKEAGLDSDERRRTQPRGNVRCSTAISFRLGLKNRASGEW